MAPRKFLTIHVIIFKKDVSDERIDEFAKVVEEKDGKIIARYDELHGFAADLNFKLVNFFGSSDAVLAMGMESEIKPGEDIDLRFNYTVMFKASISKEKVDEYYAEIPKGGGKQDSRFESFNSFAARLTIDQIEAFRNNEEVEDVSPVKPVRAA